MLTSIYVTISESDTSLNLMTGLTGANALMLKTDLMQRKLSPAEHSKCLFIVLEYAQVDRTHITALVLWAQGEPSPDLVVKVGGRIAATQSPVDGCTAKSAIDWPG